ncbi:MAG: 50S ribosomal protein L18 [Firmicutes bacterium]|nr:50S ribosomal protein L18 [Bacillota bacterium]MDY5676738.1 50S ribosomal protein L18 [Eubacteriales bacterium]
MIKKINKNENRKMRAERVREKISGTTERPRLNVFRSLNNIYAQVIDDTKGITLAQSSTMDKAIVKSIEGKTKQEAAFIVGQAVAKNAMKKGIKQVVFDRAGYQYTGRVKALADGARDAGLEF